MWESVIVVCHLFTHSVNSNLKDGEIFALREEELQLDDDLSPFNSPLFLISALFLRKQEKRQTMASACIRPQPFNRLASCHIK